VLKPGETRHKKGKKTPIKSKTPTRTAVSEPAVPLSSGKKGKKTKKRIETSANKAPAIGTGKTMRRDILVMWADTLGAPSVEVDAANKQLDRVMIALHLFQTKGQVAYRRLIGMHGGGGGTKDRNFYLLLQAKMQADIKAHYPQGFPDNYYWPEPVPNAAYPTVQDSKNPSPFTYTFCWHAEPQFIVWHRPLTAEFERLLQEHDPETYFGSGTRHSGPAALGLPYWGWEHWDGQTLPMQVTALTYVVRSSAWLGFAPGDSFPNPFARWFAPVSVECQQKEYFPPVLTDANCTTRALSFSNPMVPNIYPWLIRRSAVDPSMSDVVNRALSEENYLLFATMKKGVGSAQWSIENAHNKFHNHMGGVTLGGVQGPGVQMLPPPPTGASDPSNEFTGTMAQNQSIFDPIFWLHHSNVERQLCSWQKVWPGSKPPEAVLNTVLYPWIKPELLATGNYSWDTPVGKANDATLADWFNAELTYEYDQLLVPVKAFPTAVPPPAMMTLATASIREVQKPVFLAAHVKQRQRGGEFSLEYDGKLVATMSLLSALGSGCARCAQRELPIEFDVSHCVPITDRFNSTKLVLKRNGQQLPVDDWSLR
jgi:hypothetical protein